MNFTKYNTLTLNACHIDTKYLCRSKTSSNKEYKADVSQGILTPDIVETKLLGTRNAHV